MGEAWRAQRHSPCFAEGYRALVLQGQEEAKAGEQHDGNVAFAHHGSAPRPAASAAGSGHRGCLAATPLPWPSEMYASYFLIIVLDRLHTGASLGRIAPAPRVHLLLRLRFDSYQPRRVTT